MIGDKRVLGLIIARAGSKGLPGKNIKPLYGRPLIQWTAEAACYSKYLDNIVVSTDSDDIWNAITWHKGKEGCYLKRPKELAQDYSTAIDVVVHALENYPGFDYVVLLQATSPLRLSSDIDACIEKAVNAGSCCVSVSKPRQHPSWMFYLKDGTLMVENYVEERRQSLPPIYALNGAVYAANVPWLLKYRVFVTERVVAHIMREECSVDIDTEADFRMAEYYAAARNLDG